MWCLVHFLTLNECVIGLFQLRVVQRHTLVYSTTKKRISLIDTLRGEPWPHLTNVLRATTEKRSVLTFA